MCGGIWACCATRCRAHWHARPFSRLTVIRCIFSHCILPSYCRLKISQSWQALAHFDEDNARACSEGFAVSMLALYGTGLAVAWCRLLQTLRHTTPMPGASEFEDQIVRFKPDGSSHFLVLAWDLQTGRQIRHRSVWAVIFCKRSAVARPSLRINLRGKAVLDHWPSSQFPY